jgi:TRAP-type mannitol/chloroaromatic compound transport system permease small subunit
VPLDALNRLASVIEAAVDLNRPRGGSLWSSPWSSCLRPEPAAQAASTGAVLANDMGQLSHAVVFMIGVAYAWRWDRQVRVDLFYRGMGARAKAIVNLLGTAFLLLPWLAIVIWEAVPDAIDSVRLLERFPETGSPGFFVMKSLVVAFAAMMILQGVAVIARSIVVIRDPSRSRA